MVGELPWRPRVSLLPPQPVALSQLWALGARNTVERVTNKTMSLMGSQEAVGAFCEGTMMLGEGVVFNGTKVPKAEPQGPGGGGWSGKQGPSRKGKGSGHSGLGTRAWVLAGVVAAR